MSLTLHVVVGRIEAACTLLCYIIVYSVFFLPISDFLAKTRLVVTTGSRVGQVDEKMK